MQTRRGFIKFIMGLTACSLPWFKQPNEVFSAFEKMLTSPVEKLILPKETETLPAWEDPLKYSSLDDIIALTRPEMEGRKAGTAGDGRAAGYLVQQMSKLGLKPLGEGERSFIQAFTIPPTGYVKINGRLTFQVENTGEMRSPTVNVIGALEGETDEAIVISAHYDHLGIYQGQIYSGANDNASGVGCVLDVIRHLVKEQVVPKKTIVLAFWGAEEMGFLGSDYFVNHPTIDLKSIKAVINVDTVGNGKLGDFGLWSESHNFVVKELQAAAQNLGASTPVIPSNGHNSDHISFTKVGIPAVTLMSKEWLDNNHTPQDTLAIIKPDQLKLATAVIEQAVKSLAL